jgi:hypothetical protein
MGAEISAQATRQVNTVDRRIEVLSRQAKDFERDNMGKERGRKDAAEIAKRSRQTRLEIEEDLTALQSAYNTVVLELQVSKELKPGFAAEAARGIRKNSLRLRSNLALPVVETDVEQKLPSPTLLERAALKDLCKALYAFMTNPIFDVPGSLDVQETTRAARDLDAVLAIAERLAVDNHTSSK